MSFFSALFDGIARLWRALRGDRALPALPEPPPGSAGFLFATLRERPVNDPRFDAWVAQLRAELPFPQPAYGSSEAPANADELIERLAALDTELGESISRAAELPLPEDGVEPDWFVTLADRLLPLASWKVGLGMTSASAEVPEPLKDLAERVRRVPGIARALDWLRELREQIDALNAHYERLRGQTAALQAAWFVLLRIHLEARLSVLARGDGAKVEVLFEFPAPGQRIAELVPPPSPGSPSAGTVARVVCPAVIVRLRTITRGADQTEGCVEREWQRGASVRARV